MGKYDDLDPYEQWDQSMTDFGETIAGWDVMDADEAAYWSDRFGDMLSNEFLDSEDIHSFIAELLQEYDLTHEDIEEMLEILYE